MSSKPDDLAAFREHERQLWANDQTRAFGFTPGEKLRVQMESTDTWRGTLIAANSWGLWLRPEEGRSRVFLSWGAIVTVEAPHG